MSKSDKFCRFCLKEVIGIHLENIEKAVRNMLSVVKLKMDLDISEEPEICVDCVENLRRLYSFKLICIETENRISPFINFHIHMQIDMAQVYLKINGNKSLGDKNICRFCMCEIPSDMSIQLDTVINAMPSVKKLLEIFLPEIDLTSVRYPIICKTCHNFLQDYLIFTKNCVNVEETIMKYIQTEGISPDEKIDLRNVHQFFNKIVIKKEIDQMDVAKHEMQQSDHEILKNESFDMHIESESCLAIEESELDIKDENIDLRLIVKVPERALDSASLAVGNVKKQENGEFNDIKYTDQFFESPASYNCSEYNYKVESNEDNSVLHRHDSQFSINERNMPCGNSTFETNDKNSFKNDMPRDETALGDVKTYKCGNKDCSYKTKHRSNLNRHMLFHQAPSKVKMYKCDSENCTYKTKYKGNLSKHNLIHKDSSEVMVYKCENDDCSFETKHKASWTLHKLLHKDSSEVKIFKCKNEGCSFETVHKRSLASHNLVHEDSSDLMMYKCGYDGCSFETKRKKCLSMHELVHKDFSDVTTYKCENENCSYETKYKSCLISHRLNHKDLSEVTLYKCENENCSFQTKLKSSLTNHRLLHKRSSDVIIYKCSANGCSYETKRKGNLSRHKLTHETLSEVIAYKCTNKECSFETKYKCNLIHHELFHKDSSEENMHKCGYENCFYKTKYKRNLGIHKKNVHKELPEVPTNKRKTSRAGK